MTTTPASEENPARLPHPSEGDRVVLRRVDFVNELRRDGLAVTYLDTQGAAYLRPVIEHDFGASRDLQRAHLSSGRVVAVPGSEEQAIRYSSEADLISLPAVFNAAADQEEAHGDIVDALVLTGQLLGNMKRRLHCVPARLTLDGLAVDRTNGRAELLAPFQVDHELPPDQSFAQLAEDAIARSVKQTHVFAVKDCISEALRQLGW